ncbi:MAG: hypothetical protein AAB512_03720 [Patescibacteria group bacterium]
MKQRTQVSKVSEVSEVSKVSNGAGAQEVPGGVGVPDATTIAFKPFENSIYDTHGLLRMMDDLALIERSLFRDKEGPISTKAKDFTTSSIISLFEDLEKTGLEPTSEQKQLKFLKDLEEYLKGLPQVKINLAFAPTDTFLEKLSNQISVVVGRKTLIDLVVNQYLVGGAEFEFRGKISKQTLEDKLGEVLGKLVGVGGSV